MNETPETLRELVRLWKIMPHVAPNDDGIRKVAAHVAAWEADIARREALERLYSQSRLFFVAKRVLEGALDLGDLRIAVEEHEALHNGR